MSNIILEWTEPQEPALNTSKKMLKGAGKKTVIYYLAILTALSLIIHAIKKLIPDFDFNHIKIISGSFILLAFPLFSFIILPYFIRYENRKVTLTDKGIRKDGKPFYPWSKIVFYTIEKSEADPEIDTLVIKPHKGKRSFYSIPKDVPLSRLKNILSANINVIDTQMPEIPKITLKLSEKIIMAVFTLLCAGLTLYFGKDILIYCNKTDNNKLVVLSIAQLSMFFGPGLIYLIVTRGFNAIKTRQGILASLCLNLIYIIFVGLGAIIAEFIKYYKILTN